jgi:hypothetical protein
MLSILPRKSLLFIVPFVLACMALAARPAGQEKSPGIKGSILINIRYFGGNFIEFKLQDGKLRKMTEGKPNLFDWIKNTPYIASSEDFKNIYSSARRYHYEKDEKLAAIMSHYNLEELDNLVKQFIRTKGKLKENKYSLTGPGKKFKYFWGKYADHFIPNRQFSYVIYYDSSFPHIGALIDLNSKEISFPFGLDRLGNIAWNGNGHYVAYAAPKDRDISQSTLVIKENPTGKTLLRKELGKFVPDIAWSPDSSAVALLTDTQKVSKSLWEFVPAAVGHPHFMSTFYLDVYDLSGNLLYQEQVNGEFKSATGRLVWIP